MSVKELNRAQLDELKQAYISDLLGDPSWGDLAAAQNVDDETIFLYYDGICFVSDDFFCTVGG